MTEIVVREYERVDDLHRNGYRLIQNPKQFCFGADAVLLSGFAKVKKGENAIDLCSGTGVIPILLAAKTEGQSFTGVEIQAEMAEMANRSVRLNALEQKITIDEGDVKDLSALYKASSFDVVTVNPPYMSADGGLKNNFTPKAVARHEILCSLEDVIRSSAYLLKSGGRFYMIHRPNRLADIISLMRDYKLEPKTLRLVQPYADKEPNMALIEGVRSAKSWLKVLPTLIIYGDDGKYTDEINEIYYGKGDMQ